MKTVNKKTIPPTIGPCRRLIASLAGRFGTLQLLATIIFFVSKTTMIPVAFGNSFLTKLPNRYECLRDEEATDGQTWKDCSRDEICSKNIPPERYKPIPDDDFIDNWSGPDKLNLTCESSFKIGLLGSMVFLGIISTVLWVPILSDRYLGRRYVYTVHNLIVCGVFIGFILMTSIY